MYIVSQLTGKIKDSQDNIFTPDDSNSLWLNYYEWFLQGNLPEYVGFFDGEINEINTPIQMERLRNVVTNLRIRAKGAAIGKTGTPGYIIAQVEFYEIKYQQCINLNNTQEIEDLLENEALEFGITLEQFKTLVISMYELARDKYNLFMRMIERCRTKIQTLIENGNFTSADTAFNLVATLQNADQAQTIMEEILAL